MEQLDGRHFLQIPGPTNVPDRVLRAISAPTIDHRGPEFAELAKQVIAGLGGLCGTSRPVALYPSSGTGAWEAALGSVDYQHDAWGVDVTIWGSQKGMMLPPGLGMNAVSAKALQSAESAGLPRSYWDWRPVLAAADTGQFPYTPATNLLFGLREALAIIGERGTTATFTRHHRHAEATRRAVRGWGLEIWCTDPDAYSSTLTAVLLPEMGLAAAGVRLTGSGVLEALSYLGPSAAA